MHLSLPLRRTRIWGGALAVAATAGLAIAPSALADQGPQGPMAVEHHNDQQGNRHDHAQRHDRFQRHDHKRHNQQRHDHRQQRDPFQEQNPGR